MSVTNLRSLSTFTIGFLLAGIISPVFQMVGRSWMAADSWKMKWMMGRRLYMHLLSSSVPILSGPGAFQVFILLNTLMMSFSSISIEGILNCMPW